MTDSGGCGERQSREAHRQDEAPQDHLRDPQRQHDPGPGPVLSEPGQAAGQRRGAEGSRAADAAAAGQRAHRHGHGRVRKHEGGRQTEDKSIQAGLRRERCRSSQQRNQSPGRTSAINYPASSN